MKLPPPLRPPERLREAAPLFAADPARAMLIGSACFALLTGRADDLALPAGHPPAAAEAGPD